MRRPAVRLAIIAATFVLGLALDARADLPAQIAMSVVVWAVLSWAISQESTEIRFAAMACVVIATAGEMFLSLVWGLYAYRLGNIPLFVPPGHALLLLLGLSLSRRLSEAAAAFVIVAAGVLALVLAASHVDTLGLALFALLAATSAVFPSQRRLYASTFILALALELYGTALGSWTWSHEVAFPGLVTTNPPFAAGAFYAALDALTACAALVLARARPGAPRPSYR